MRFVRSHEGEAVDCTLGDTTLCCSACG